MPNLQEVPMQMGKLLRIFFPSM